MSKSAPDAVTASAQQRAKYLSPLMTLLAVIAYGAAIQWYFGWSKLIAAWTEIPLWQPLLALVLMFFTYLVRGLRIYDYFRPATSVVTANGYVSAGGQPNARAGLTLCCQIMLTHNLMNNLLPMRTGEASFPLLMRSNFAMPLSRSTAGLLLLRLLDLQVLLCIGWLALVGYAGAAPWLWWSLPPLVLAPLLVLPFVPLLKRWQKRVTQPRLQHFLEQALQATPTNFGQLLRAWLLTWLTWGTKIVIFALVLRWFADTDWWSAIAACIGGELSSVLPIHAPGGLGTYEASMFAAAKLLGVEGDWVLFAGVQLHLLIILSTLLGGLVALLLPTKRPH